MFAGNYAPAGWEFCSGQLVQISDNETLFQLIGTTYGGDGQTTFGLPDLRGRLPIHQGVRQGTQRTLAQTGGVETVTLNTQQMPDHSHPLTGAAITGDQVSPAGNLPANSLNVTAYINEDQDGNFNAGAVAPRGGSQPHENMQPFLCVDFIISMFGIFPSPT